MAPTRRSPEPAARERTASRLLASSAERSYDPEVDLDWDAPLVEGKWYHPDHLISLYGTEIWDRLTPEERIELGRIEIGWVATQGILAEIALMSMLLRVAAIDPTSARSQYALTEIADECRHSTMFGRSVAKYRGDLPPFPQPPVSVEVAARIITALLPINALAWAGTLLVEDLTDKMQRETTADESVQPLIRMVNRIHILEEARHMTYAREELARCAQDAGTLELAVSRVLLGLLAYGTTQLRVHPIIYKYAGLNPRAARRQAKANPYFRAQMADHAERLVRTLRGAGLIEGRVATFLWRRSFMLPTGPDAA